MSTAVTCPPRRFHSWATRVVPVNMSIPVRAPAREKSSPSTGTSRRLEPRYLITAQAPSDRPAAEPAGELFEHHARQEIEMAARHDDHRVSAGLNGRGLVHLSGCERALER